MHDSSIFNIRIDFKKSKDSYIFDKNTNQSYLDFFGLYASLPLGYSHPVFQSQAFKDDIERIAAIKVPNCEVISDEAQEFLKEFSGHEAMRDFKYFHFCCTGALAIEAAIKIALDQKKAKAPQIISFKESFHGINSYGGFVTDRFVPVNGRLDGFPEIGWIKIHNPKYIYRDNKIDQEATQKGFERFLSEINDRINREGADNIAAVLVEPIQATYGDNYFPPEFFTTIRELCDRHNICLIFDEIQTGFGVTGKMWYFQHTDIVPDIVTFGKKTQVSGVMVKENFNETFKTPIRLEVTWDGDLVDMTRCKHILRAYQKYNILENVNQRGEQIVPQLKDMAPIKNVRATGLLICFDFDSQQLRDEFFNGILEKRLICNKTRDKSIRLRPNLNVSSDEVEKALAIFKNVCERMRENQKVLSHEQV